MDFSAIIDKKLLGRDKCTCSVLATKCSRAPSKEPVAVALVECEGEHGFFTYNCTTVPASKPDDLTFDCAIPVNNDFILKVSNDAGANGANQAPGSLPIKISTGTVTFYLELPHGYPTQLMLSSLKHALQVYSQNSGFGISSIFGWLEKYSEVASDTSNPFLADRFDPNSQNTNMDGWPFSHILQSNVGTNCPVVKDTRTMEHSVTPDRSSMSDSGSYHGSLQIPESDPLRRSYDHSMEQLGLAVTNDTVTNRRDDLIRHIMQQREDSYTELHTYRLFCGTWNVNGQGSASIKSWLSPEEDSIPPDIYAIGFQELDLSKQAFIFSESPREAEWYRRVKEALHHKAKYKKVKLIRLIGMMLIVFVRVELTEYLYDIMASCVGTGVLGMGNKGGVGVRLGFHDSTICFINSHLAAHVEETTRRNQDFRDINSRMAFSKSRSQAEYTIADHDMVFWLGDLNYRLSDIGNDRAKKMIEQRELMDLLNYDQLCRQIVMKKVFLDYLEGQLNFIPTYKYDPGTDDWDTSEKCRTPAWCDRILWRGHHIRQLKYRSHMDCRVSDHKPVSAVFDIEIKVINKKQYHSVYEDIMKQLDRMENEYLPQVMLSTTDVQFVDVKFIELQSNILTIVNTGQGPVQFEFINKPHDTVFCKPWLTVTPSKGIIDVGQRLEVQLDVYVNSDTAGPLNTTVDKIEDILVLHLEGGKDLFITLAGNYIPSTFGTSLETLVNMFNPIRKVPPAQLKELAKRGELSSDRPLDVPKELHWLLNHLMLHGLYQENLFSQDGRPSEIHVIRDCLDQGIPENIVGDVNSVAEAVLLFLEALPEPVVPFSAYHRCLDCHTSFSACKQVLLDIPLCHRNVFKYICAFLRELLHHSAQNNLDAKSLALLFGGLLLRPLPAGASKHGSGASVKSGSREDENKRSAFVYHFLVNEYDD